MVNLLVPDRLGTAVGVQAWATRVRNSADLPRDQRARRGSCERTGETVWTTSASGLRKHSSACDLLAPASTACVENCAGGVAEEIQVKPALLNPPLKAEVSAPDVDQSNAGATTDLEDESPLVHDHSRGQIWFCRFTGLIIESQHARRGRHLAAEIGELECLKRNLGTAVRHLAHRDTPLEMLWEQGEQFRTDRTVDDKVDPRLATSIGHAVQSAEVPVPECAWLPAMLHLVDRQDRTRVRTDRHMHAYESVRQPSRGVAVLGHRDTWRQRHQASAAQFGGQRCEDLSQVRRVPDPWGVHEALNAGTARIGSIGIPPGAAQREATPVDLRGGSQLAAVHN